MAIRKPLLLKLVKEDLLTRDCAFPRQYRQSSEKRVTL